jgi:DNA replication protein DnaC
MIYNDQCPECIKEFNLLVDKREQEISQELEEKAKQKRLNDRITKLKELGVGKRYIDNSFDNYLADAPEKQNALTKCKELCNDIMNDEKPSNLIMVGGVGTGKTHLANSMVINLFDNKKRSERINMIDMIRSLKSTWSKESEQTEEDLLKYFTSIDLLIVDEVGVQFNSDTEKMFVFDIINGRYENCLPTVIISNLDINGVKEVIGDRCVDRLREDGGKVIAFNWNSHR